jgi:hypothetical protein
MAYMNRDRPGGAFAATTAEPAVERMMIAERRATKAALRRPDRTRNVAPSYRIDAVSASNVGSVGPERTTLETRTWALRH